MADQNLDVEREEGVLTEEADLPARKLRRPRRLQAKSLPLTVEQILRWADEHHARTGTWPTSKSGRVGAALYENWAAIDAALTQGFRGLPGGISLVGLLVQERDFQSKAHLPDLSEVDILAWADAFHAAQGCWPSAKSGPVDQGPGFTWHQIDRALREGRRGFPGGSSLSRLLAQKRGHRRRADLPHLTEEQILRWADAFFAEHGRWPTHLSGPIAGSNGETWSGVNCALAEGLRGLTAGNSLIKVLAVHRGRRNKGDLPALTIEQVLLWADQFHEREGRWPTEADQDIPGTNGERWYNIAAALRAGWRGLCPGSSLAQLLAEHRGVRNIHALPPLAVEDILRWAKSYHERHGRWPHAQAGPVEEAPGETWCGINAALRTGLRGLPGGTTLYRLLVDAGLRPALAGCK